tara:strand:+ start:607 stop:1149 length:543 start_codon:yes stop_codon:yes gene_type:complete
MTTIEMAETLSHGWWLDDEKLERFAALVRADERNACMKECEGINSAEDYYGERPELICAESIRARGQKRDFWEGYVPEPDKRQQALDKKAENARELGLDYEPVAWMYQCSADHSGPVLMQHRQDWAESGSGLWTEAPLYTSPPAQPVVPDAIHHTDTSETLEYIQGWNDCRALMLEMRRP